MRNLTFYMGDLIRTKKTFFLILILVSITAIILGIFAGINFSGGVLVIDLSNIAYIQFLKNECGFVSMIFKLLLSLFIFFAIIYLTSFISAFLFLSVLFYMYLIYSQTVVFISLIMIYGFFNCIILALILLIYILIICFLFLLLCLDLSKHCNCQNYFNLTLNCQQSKTIIFLLGIAIVSLIFCIMLSILKSFVILLVY